MRGKREMKESLKKDHHDNLHGNPHGTNFIKRNIEVCAHIMCHMYIAMPM